MNSQHQKALEEGRRVHEQELKKNKPGKVKVEKGHAIDGQTNSCISWEGVSALYFMGYSYINGCSIFFPSTV